MLTYTLTLATTLALLLTGALSLLSAARHPPGDERQRAAWRLVGAGFLCHATDKLVQNLWGGTLIHRKLDSPAIATYLRWSQVFDHSRTFLMMAVLGGLAVLAFQTATPGRRFWSWTGITMFLALVGGGVLGWLQGGFNVGGHYSAVAVWDVVELAVLMVVLFLLLLRNSVDRILWGLLAAYGCTIALGVFWFMLLAQYYQGVWQPPAWSIALERLVFFALMAGLAARRLHLANRRKPVHGMLGQPMQLSSTTLH